MLTITISNLTTENRRELEKKGITKTTISAWKTGRRRPTYAQCVSLADVTKCDLVKLLIETALGDATKEQQEKFKHLLK